MSSAGSGARTARTSPRGSWDLRAPPPWSSQIRTTKRGRVPAASGHRTKRGSLKLHRHRLALGAATVAGVALTAIAASIVLGSPWSGNPELAAIGRSLVIAVPVAVGLWAWYTRPDERFGPLLAAAGFLWFLTTLAESSNDVVYSTGRVAVLARRAGADLHDARLPVRTAAGQGRALARRLLRPPRRDLLPADGRARRRFPGAESRTARAWPTARRTHSWRSTPSRSSSPRSSSRCAIRSPCWGSPRSSSCSFGARAARRGSCGAPSVRSWPWPVLRALLFVAYVPLRRWAPESTAVDVIGWLYVLCLPGMAVAFLVGLLARAALRRRGAPGARAAAARASGPGRGAAAPTGGDRGSDARARLRGPRGNPGPGGHDGRRERRSDRGGRARSGARRAARVRAGGRFARARRGGEPRARDPGGRIHGGAAGIAHADPGGGRQRAAPDRERPPRRRAAAAGGAPHPARARRRRREGRSGAQRRAARRARDSRPRRRSKSCARSPTACTRPSSQTAGSRRR